MWLLQVNTGYRRFTYNKGLDLGSRGRMWELLRNRELNRTVAKNELRLCMPDGGQETDSAS